MRCQIARSNTIIVDDEKYLAFSNDEIPQNVSFYDFDKEHASDKVKYRTKDKHPKKGFSSVGIVIERYFNTFSWYYKMSSRYCRHLY